MKRIGFALVAIVFWALSGSVALAGGVDINGEWVVDSDAGDSMITIPVSNYTEAPLVWTPPRVTLGGIVYSSDRVLFPQGKTLYDFTLISAGTFFDFTANGSKLTGSIVRGVLEEPIFDGKISGNTITFNVREIIDKKTYSYFYTGEVSEDGIRFKVRPPRDGGKHFQFTAKRVVP